VTAAPRHAHAPTARVIDFFERLTPEDVTRLGEIYTADARFKDPFNEVQGLPAVEAVFSHMYRVLEGPRFVILVAVAEGDQCFLTWDFRFRFRRFDRGTDQCVRGATHIVFARDGRIALHRDYWDAAEELYEKLPAVGTLMRWLKRRANS
jgi:steroid Delta-isomerase